MPKSVHQGRLLKELTKRSGKIQEEVAPLFGYSRSGFRLLFKEEKLKEGIISKASEIFGVDTTIFSTPDVHESVSVGGKSQYNQPTQSGTDNILVIGNYTQCMGELVAVQRKLIAEQERTIRLQEEIINMRARS